MKRLMYVLAGLLLALTACSANKQDVNVKGEWYGVRDMSLVKVCLNENGTFSIESEAMSSMSMNGKYKLDAEATPMAIDFTETTSGMDGAGLLRMNEDGTLEMCIRLGAPGMTQRVNEIKPQPEDMTVLYLKLSKDKEKLTAALTPHINIPKEAQKAFERNARLGAGINLNAVVDGNLHPGYERDAPLGDEEIQSIAEVGFQSVRLDVCWVKHCMDSRPYTIDPAFFDKVDHIVDECFKNGMAVSIDMHYYPYINMSNDDKKVSMEENYVRLNMLWEQIAEHYKDYSNDMLFFDLLNEPNLRMGADKWNEVIAQLVKTIRKTNLERTLIVGTPNLGQSWTLNYLQLPADDWNLIVEFHYYLPHLFTHQGLSYAMAEGSHGVGWQGTEEEKKPIESDLDYCLRWSKSHGRPLNMGEYGVVNTADSDSRARYIGYMKNAAEKRGFSSHLWGYREVFMIRDEKTGAWETSILEEMKLK